MSTPTPEAAKPLKIAGIEIPVAEQTPLVLALVAVIQRLEREVRDLRDEIHRGKKTTRRPEIKPSQLLNPTPPKSKDRSGKRPGSAKRMKTKALVIDEIREILPVDLPPNAKLEGHRDFVVQDLIFKSQTICYRRLVYRLPDGSLIVGQRPQGVDSHFGPGLREFILMQVHQNHVTQGRLLEQLREANIDISAGQLSNILLQGHEAFHAEKDDLLPVARQISGYLHCDDTSARHRGQSAVCTHIGNELFASFSTTDCKSRLNFLRLLCQPREMYRWCEEAAQSLEFLGAGRKLVARMAAKKDDCWIGREAWERQLNRWKIKGDKHRTWVTEAALYGTLLTESWYAELGLISDDAPQFKAFGFIHGLCWVHGERKIDRLIPLTAMQRKAQTVAQRRFWAIYKSLKKYKLKPTEAARASIEKRFDGLCQTKTGYPALNEALRLLHAKRDEFLTVLDYPHLPLHNNLSERDIREYARLRKISAGTRSDMGRRCRDTFLSLKKTCRKLGIRFSDYLRDRLQKLGNIPALTDLMRLAALAQSTPSPAIDTG